MKEALETLDSINHKRLESQREYKVDRLVRAFLTLKVLTSVSWSVGSLFHCCGTFDASDPAHAALQPPPHMHQPDTRVGRLDRSCCVLACATVVQLYSLPFWKVLTIVPSSSLFLMLYLLFSGASGIPERCSKCNFHVLSVELLWFFGSKTVFSFNSAFCS